MKVVEISRGRAVVSAGNLRRSADISLLKDVRKGEYILIHAGFAIERVNEKEAIATLKAIKEIDEVRR
jgi:hydrogenase expression/formation protein HypC